MNLAAIDELRGALETGFAANINLLLATYTRINAAAAFKKYRPRVEIKVTINNATGYKRAFPAEGIIRFARWHFSVTFTVVTETEGPQASPLHGQMVARVRGYASSAAQSSWTDITYFPYHYIAEALRDTGSPSTVKPQEGLEQTSLTFVGQVGVRESAWA